MPESKAVVTRDGEPNTSRFLFYCPACQEGHFFQTEPGPQPHWTWNGDTEKPTVNPSIRIRSVRNNPALNHVCHFFIRNGQIEYCGDCTHSLAGQTVAMVPWDET